jgi:OpgC protein
MAIEAILPPKVRDYRLDLLRGFANWAIFLDHIPNNPVNWIYSTQLRIQRRRRSVRFHLRLCGLLRLRAYDA